MNKNALFPLAREALHKANEAFAEADKAYRHADDNFRAAIKNEEQARTSFHDATNRYNTLTGDYLKENIVTQEAFDFMNAAGRAYAAAMETMKQARGEWMKAVESRAQAEKMLDQAQVAYSDLRETE